MGICAGRSEAVARHCAPHPSMTIISTMRYRFGLAAVLLVLAIVLRLAPVALAGEPERVSFLSADEKTMLVGYLFAPPDGAKRPAPAVVMLHGRAGPYSSLAHGVYTAATLTHRHQNWGQLWASRGYFALMVDSFGPRGYPAGFAAGTYDSRPLHLRPQAPDRGSDVSARGLRGTGLCLLSSGHL